MRTAPEVGDGRELSGDGPCESPHAYYQYINRVDANWATNNPPSCLPSSTASYTPVPCLVSCGGKDKIKIRMDNCTLDCIELMGNFTQEGMCQFAQDNCLQDTVQIVQGYYCLVNSSIMILSIFSFIVLIMVYYSINIATDDFLAPCLEDFIVKLNMSEAMAGITFLALANGAPDIITAVVAGTSDSSTTVLIPFGSLYGAAIFSMAFILSQVIVYSKGKEVTLHVRQNIVPLGFYIGGTLYIILISLFYGKMNIVVAVIFFSLYIVYFLYVLYEERHKKKKAEKGASMLTSSQDPKKSVGDQVDQVYHQIQNQDQERDKENLGAFGKMVHWVRHLWLFIFNYTIPVILKEEISMVRLIISVVLSPIVLAFAYGLSDSIDSSLLSIPYAAWFCLPSLLLLIYSIVNLVRKTRPYFTTVFNIYGFIVVVTWITLIVNVLINVMELLQLLTNINPVFLGLTVFAGAGSIGDYLSIVAFAKRGLSSTAVSGVFSGQLLNFLIGFGLAKIITSLSNGQVDFNIFDITGSTFDVLSDLIVVIVIAMSFVYMIVMVVLILYKKGKLEVKESKVMRVFYFVFIGVALGLSVVTDFFNQVGCDM